ncbi:DinB family protein [Sporosarcina jiandibaonis]|uniref:DinB family protein n=1 Tax=Sporosarcina jiandibaonis TaxID=2715535 RepID=UPI00155537A6|nr:DinB family protein [Sporosarcina jiandibaonis]
MMKFFEYNWQVRDEWFNWCKQLTPEDLLKDRIGGVGSILYTLFHIIDVEYSWIRAILGEVDVVVQFNDYNTLEKVKSLSDTLRNEILKFIQSNPDESCSKLVSVSWDEATYTRGEILHHIVAHEIHHVGQLSVWARELELSPVSANFIGRDFSSI